MASLNKVALIGNVGKDPELRRTTSDKAVANFSLATSFKSGDNESTEWHKIVAWGKTAENAAKYLKKGSQVYIDGHLQTRSYEQDGIKRYSTEVVADQIIYLGGSKGQSQPPTSQKSDDFQPPQGNDAEDLPF